MTNKFVLVMARLRQATASKAGGVGSRFWPDYAFWASSDKARRR